jgi:hypothetical protein
MHEATLTLFEQGRKAYADGLDLDDNPYRSNGWYFHDEWTRGWEDMQRTYTSECRIRKKGDVYEIVAFKTKKGPWPK